VCRGPHFEDSYVLATSDRTDESAGWSCFPADQVLTVVSDLKAVAKVGRWIRSLV